MLHQSSEPASLSLLGFSVLLDYSRCALSFVQIMLDATFAAVPSPKQCVRLHTTAGVHNESRFAMQSLH